MRKTIISLILLSLTACSGSDGGSSVKPGPVEGTASVSSKPTVTATPFACPTVGIIEDLRSITLFDNNEAPDPSKIQGYAKIEDFSGGCTYENGMVTVDLDVMFSGKKGNVTQSSRVKESNVAFPYFIAFSDEQGNILNKEVFAVALRFNEGLDTTHQAEHLKPRIPMPDPTMGNRYQILIGFQLNKAQLDFNRGG